MMTTAERSAAIRKALKATHGWTSKHVSVVTHEYAGGSSIRISIKDPAVPLSAVKAIADGHESVRYDHYSGEILSGGNRFVFVDYHHDAVLAFRAKYLPAVKAAVGSLAPGRSLMPVEGTPFHVGLGRDGNRLSLWGETHLVESYGPEGLAEAIGARMTEPEPARTTRR
jgi:hypothetical protein